MVEDYTLRNEHEELVTLYEDVNGIVVGNPRRSFGYLYVAAWLKDEAAPLTDEPIKDTRAEVLAGRRAKEALQMEEFELRAKYRNSRKVENLLKLANKLRIMAEQRNDAGDIALWDKQISYLERGLVMKHYIF
jgi:hypothetical protein